MMKGNSIWSLGLAALMALLIVSTVFAAGKGELDALRRATIGFAHPEGAMTAGYEWVPGLDHCFDNPGVGGMGYHLIKTSSLDLSLSELEPEAIVYVPLPDGKLKMGAVEYIVPAEAWEAAGNSEPPMVLGRSLHLNPALGVYVLHAWIWRSNPNGLFEDWNPRVTCP